LIVGSSPSAAKGDPTLGVVLLGCCLSNGHGPAVLVARCVAPLALILTTAGSPIGFLWYHVIGCGAVVVLAWTSGDPTAC
jgi:hypothetical protein